VGQTLSLVEEKSIIAHDGAILSVKWDQDGCSLSTAGEDGEVKIWSQTGYMRTKVACFNRAVNCTAWGPDSLSLVAAYGNILSIIQIQRRAENRQWNVQQAKGPAGIVLAVDWNSITNLIVCGGEDRSYRLFNSYGVSLFVSDAYSHAITSVAWRPNGDVFAISYFKNLHLCEMKGWNYTKHYLDIESSVTDMKWSIDGAQLIAVCNNGSTIVGELVGKKKQWNGVSALLNETDNLVLNDNTKQKPYIKNVNVSR